MWPKKKERDISYEYYLMNWNEATEQWRHYGLLSQPPYHSYMQTGETFLLYTKSFGITSQMKPL